MSGSTEGPATTAATDLTAPVGAIGRLDQRVASGDQSVMGGLRFVEVAEEAGISWTVQNGVEAGELTILETLGAGCAILDFDQDGRLDMIALGGGTIGTEHALLPAPIGLFRQQEPWRFMDVAGAAGIQVARHYHHGAYVADVNGDGFPDLLVTGYGGLQLFVNQGDGTYQDVTTASGLSSDTAWSTAAAWGDWNDDGMLDLFVGHYVDWSWDNNPRCTNAVGSGWRVCGPTDFRPLPSSAYLSAGDGTFRDASAELGLNLPAKALGVVTADFDNDGALEIYVANDAVNNQYYHRTQAGPGPYVDRGLVAGVAVGETGLPDGSMGVDVGDLDGDGQLDLWVANFENQSFAYYRNVGQNQFMNASRAAGITAVGRLAVGFGTTIADFDGNGWPDLFCANGHVQLERPRESIRQLPFLFRSQQGKRFRNVSAELGGYFAETHLGRGVACADLDANGTPDLVVTAMNEPVAVLRNETPIEKWLAIRLVGTNSHRDAIGTQVTVRVGDRRWIQQRTSGASYLSSNGPNLLFGLGAIDERQPLTVEIRWPGGAKQELIPLRLNDVIVVIEPSPSIDAVD